MLRSHEVGQVEGMEQPTPRYQTLKVWTLGMDIAESVYRATSTFPNAERFGISSQLRRAAVSIPSNIAEGSARRTTPDLLYFVSISAGSTNELQTQLILSNRLGYLTNPEYATIMDMVGEESKMLNGMRKTLERRIEKQ